MSRKAGHMKNNRTYVSIRQTRICRIDGVDYKFPIRTAICKARNIVEQPKLFDNHNIAFFYEKMMETTFQECKTDVKWEENEDCIKIFIQELLLIIKCDVLQHNGEHGYRFTHFSFFQ